MNFKNFFEVSKDDINDVISHVGKVPASSLPFNNIFGSKYRVVIPFKEDQAGELKKRIESRGYRVDFSKGLAYKKTQTRMGEKEVAIKIGKILTPEEKNMWSKVANELDKDSDKDDYSIVLSRHPIDVLRMSDWEHLHSCHAKNYQGTSYYHCAISEAKHGGLIAFLVHNEELKHVPNLQDEEVFEDRERHIRGIMPIARVRVRRFTNGTTDIAIPEIRTYGGNRGQATFDNFQKVVTDFLRDKQQNIIKERPKAKDFKLAGGSYQDNPAGQLFNKFFKDTIDQPNDIGGYLNSEDMDLADQRRTEIHQIDGQYNKFKNPIAAYYMEEDEWQNVNQMFYFDGRAEFAFPHSKFLKKPEQSLSTLGRLISRSIQISIDHVEFEGNKITVQFVSKNGNPDDYRDYLENLKKIDSNYYEVRKHIENELINAGYIEDSEFNKAANETQWNNFNNFQLVDYDLEEQGVITLEAKVKLSAEPTYLFMRHFGDTNTDAGKRLYDNAQKVLKDTIDNYLKQVMHFKTRQKLLPFTDFVAGKQNDFSVDTTVELRQYPGHQNTPFAKITLQILPDKHNVEVLKDTLKKVHILDNQFNVIVKLIKDNINRYANSQNNPNHP